MISNGFLYFKWLCGTTYKNLRYFPHKKKTSSNHIFAFLLHMYLNLRFFFKIEKNVYQKVINMNWIRVFLKKIPRLHLTYSGLMKSMTTRNGAPIVIYTHVFIHCYPAPWQKSFSCMIFILFCDQKIVFLFVCFL